MNNKDFPAICIRVIGVMHDEACKLELEAAQVKLRCGPPKLVPVENTTTDHPLAIEKLDNSSARAEQLEKQLRNFLAEIETTKARGLFANLAEALCSDDSFAETRDTADCWNGHRVGEYTKALVKPGIDAQKYNPELKWTETTPDPNIRHLSDKLRYMRQVVLGRYKSDRWDLVPDSLTVQQSGSGGSGDGIDDDDDDVAVDGEGSGSGDGRDYDLRKTEISPTTQVNGNKIGKTDKPKGSAFGLSYSLPTLVLLTLSTRLLI
ncbi:division abnormally delayed protein [Halyomorpha halys]|uniref:division abnormally delayed protein n=1 Tax=Halyomorpha halys TaxID=286706 RepID=UPI0034D1E4FA